MEGGTRHMLDLVARATKITPEAARLWGVFRARFAALGPAPHGCTLQ